MSKSHRDSLGASAGSAGTERHSSLIIRVQSVLYHIGRRWLQEPIGVVVPVLALLILLLAPQTPDMLAAIAPKHDSALLPWGRAIAYGLAAAFVGFSAWFWMRAALQGAHKEDECFGARAGRDEAPMDVDSRSWRKWVRRTSREWAPRIALVVAGGIAAVPLLLSGRAARGVGEEELVAGVSGLVLVALLFVLVWLRRRFGFVGGMAPEWMWQMRTTSVFGGSPLGWQAAVVFVLLSATSIGVLALRPQWVEAVFPTPVAALTALALLIGPLVIALALMRDAVTLVLWLLLLTWRLCAGLLGQARSRATLADVRGMAGVGGGGLLVLLMFFPRILTLEPAWLYQIRHPEIASNVEYEQLKEAVGERPKIAKALQLWRNARIEQGHPQGRPLPLIIVAAEGGASRAATWLLSVMRRLDQETRGEFGRHLFAISGVSGGSLGAVTYLQALREYGRPDSTLDWQNSNVQRGLQALAEGDLLAAAAATYFLNDTVGRLFLNLWRGMPDRAEALERAFERHWADPAAWAIASDRAEGMLLAMRSDLPAGAPHLLLNGTDVHVGRRLITSTIRFDPEDDLFPGSEDLMWMLHQDIAASTAVTNSARFPYISPAGRFFLKGTPRQVVDGGYFENYGLRTATELAIRIGRISDEMGYGLLPIVVVVSNDADACGSDSPDGCLPDEDGNTPPLMKDIAVHCDQTPRLLSVNIAQQRDARGRGVVPEALAPALGLYATRGAHGLDAQHIARRLLCPASAQPNGKADAGAPSNSQSVIATTGIDLSGLPRLFHLALPKPVPPEEAAPMNWVLNRTAAEYLLGSALDADFNRQQAQKLHQTLKSALGVSGSNTTESSLPTGAPVATVRRLSLLHMVP